MKNTMYIDFVHRFCSLISDYPMAPAHLPARFLFFTVTGLRNHTRSQTELGGIERMKLKEPMNAELLHN